MRGRARVAAALFSAFLFLTPAALADEASRIAKVEEYFRLSRMEQTYEQTTTLMLNQVWASISRQLQEASPVPLTVEDVSELRNTVSAVLRGSIGWERMRAEYVKLYAEAFSDEEVEAIVAFYSSPAGRSMVSKTPEMMTKSVGISQVKIREIQPALQTALQEFFDRKAEERTKEKQQEGAATQAPKP